jgi:ectoine hydroxylase-related dioxygenase (phytanoyl-CoA dioxygenase family)
MKHQDLESISDKGYCIIENFINDEWINAIRETLPKHFARHEAIRRENDNPIVSNGIAMNVLADDKIYIDFLRLFQDDIIPSLEEHYFKGPCILNSFSALNNLPNENVFHKKIHRDVRDYVSDTNILINILVMIDDFTIDNGGTLLLPYSHLRRDAPSDKYFDMNSVQMTGKAGDIIIWDSNIFHASGKNTSDNVRRGLPITLSQPYYKQLFDYPRNLGDLNEDLKMKSLLGYDSRVPTSLDEWYQPDDKILYKKIK